MEGRVCLSKKGGVFSLCLRKGIDFIRFSILGLLHEVFVFSSHFCASKKGLLFSLEDTKMILNRIQKVIS